ncbi:nSTAND1 domain-containing NTPase [Thiothrix lacustris]|uniref:nSTAND1 domain-containing NTPase n=1 Tax=Thiothrix lacustris TaxID=525917 RepID=UPI0027E516B6|nr:TIR domain-containing protein [Thiothrix lacustris]WMP17300.1 TIR domain-containing protein [Thiothrix lacustris]
MLKVFLSHNSADKPLVEQLAHRLRAEGVDPWLDKWNLIPGDPWQEEIEKALDECDCCLVFIGAEGMGPWQNAEMRVAIDQRISHNKLRVIPVLLPNAQVDRSRLPGFLINFTWVEFRYSLDDHENFQRLLAGIRGEKPGAVDAGEQQNPYRGLQVFDVEHTRFFFGRKNVVGWLLDEIRPSENLHSTARFQDNRFLVIVGDSGSGKSSVARAGVLAALRNGQLPHSQQWPQVIFKPGEKPLLSLAVALNGHPDLHSRWDTAELIEKFRQQPLQLHYLGLEWLHCDENRRLVILADQFEEIFTLCKNDISRQAFLDNLLTAAREPDGQIILILTLRADFYRNCIAYPELARSIEAHQHLLTPMSEPELQEAIEIPAQLVGCELEAGLTHALLQEAQNQPGNLPLLQYSLMLLWRERQSRVLRLHDYQQFGGLAGVLEQQAEKIYNHFSTVEQEQCRLIFLRLVQPGEGTTDTRRRASLDEFDQQADGERIIRQLADARLLTTQGNDTKAFMEVSHEALIRSWPRLRIWIDAEREYLRVQHQISSATKEWEQHGKDTAWLLTGSRLVAAEEWLQQHPEPVSGLERQFVEASTGQRDLEKRKELKRQRQLRWLSGIMTVIAVIMIAAAGVAWHFSEKSERAAQESKQEELQANYNLAKAFEEKALSSLSRGDKYSTNNLERQSEYRKAWLYALEAQIHELPAKRIAILPESFGKLSAIDGKFLSPEHMQTPALNLGASVFALAYSPDSKTIATDSNDNTVGLWDATSGQLLKTLQGHTGFVNALVYSPNGKVIASGSADNTIRLWDAKNGQLLKVLSGHSAGVAALAYNPNGKTIASASGDNTVRLWDAESGKLLKTLQGHTNYVAALAYSPNGKVIASGSADNTIRLWDTNSGETLKVLHGHSDAVRTLAYSPNGKVIASGSSDKTIRLWDTNSGETLNILQGHTDFVNALAYSPDGKVIASGSDDQTIRLWNTENGQIQKVIQGHVEAVRVLAYSPDGRIIASGSDDKTVRLWNATSGEPLKALQGHAHTVFALAYSPNGKVIASASADRTIRLWDAASGEALNIVLQGHSDTVRTLAYSPDGKTIASGSYDSTVRLWDAASGKLLKMLRGHSSSVAALAYSPNGKTIASASGDNTVRLWDAESGELLKTLQGHTNYVEALAYSPDGKVIASASWDGTIRLWNAESGETLQVLQSHSGYIHALAYSPDGKVIASGSDNSTVQLWDAGSGKILKTLNGQIGKVYALTYSPDGKVIVSGSEDKNIRLWDTQSGNFLRILNGHSRAVYALAYSPDGKVIASGSGDHTMRLWDAQNEEVPQTLRGHTANVLALTYSPNGKTIASGSVDKTVRLWNAASGSLLKVLQGHTGFVKVLAYSPNGKVIASGSDDKTIRLWDTTSGETLKVLTGHSDFVGALAYSPNGKVIASGSFDKTIRLWDAESGELLKTLQGHTGSVDALAYSPDGKVIASLASSLLDKSIRLWDAESGELLKILREHNSVSSAFVGSALAYSPNGKVIASSSSDDDNAIQLWNTESGKLLKTLQGHSGTVLTLAYSPDGKMIASGSYDGIRLWDADSGAFLKTLQGHTASVNALAYSPDGKAIVSNSSEYTVRLWKLTEPAHRLLYDFNPSEVYAALCFLWQLEPDELEFKYKPRTPALLPQEGGYYFTFTNETRKYAELLKAPRPDETKMDQLVRFLEEQGAYKKPSQLK